MEKGAKRKTFIHTSGESGVLSVAGNGSGEPPRGGENTELSVIDGGKAPWKWREADLSAEFPILSVHPEDIVSVEDVKPIRPDEIESMRQVKADWGWCHVVMDEDIFSSIPMREEGVLLTEKERVAEMNHHFVDAEHGEVLFKKIDAPHDAFRVQAAKEVSQHFIQINELKGHGLCLSSDQERLYQELRALFTSGEDLLRFPLFELRIAIDSARKLLFSLQKEWSAAIVEQKRNEGRAIATFATLATQIGIPLREDGTAVGLRNKVKLRLRLRKDKAFARQYASAKEYYLGLKAEHLARKTQEEAARKAEKARLHQRQATRPEAYKKPRRSLLQQLVPQRALAFAAAGVMAAMPAFMRAAKKESRAQETVPAMVRVLEPVKNVSVSAGEHRLPKAEKVAPVARVAQTVQHDAAQEFVPDGFTFDIADLGDVPEEKEAVDPLETFRFSLTANQRTLSQALDEYFREQGLTGKALRRKVRNTIRSGEKRGLAVGLVHNGTGGVGTEVRVEDGQLVGLETYSTLARKGKKAPQEEQTASRDDMIRGFMQAVGPASGQDSPLRKG